ncbi:beta-phosphoglucomutase [Aestuariibacter halophilus]|uniref:Beta-phosphoglucomutase n=1 Tax=Fluctibacter halophilus TaxID=226011 RepID=A0ABS8GD55_9ALTE|nr:beta-phosphoglucomutase [Aestuariibacter halophilus]MCC2618036.1 beta-phosphoglucomutase [Aestuariibacter halophilus]
MNRAVIFDLDGVITDTAEFHFQAWLQLAREVDAPFDRQMNEDLKGIDRMTSLARILAHSPHRFDAQQRDGLAARKNTHYQHLIEGITPQDVFPGVPALLSTLQTSGYRLGVASVSKNAAVVLERLALTSQFDFIADANRIQNPKPDPEIFLTVAKALGVEPRHCVGVEDAAAGVEAIRAAGMPAIGVGPRSALPLANHWVDRTGDIRINDIERLLV